MNFSIFNVLLIIGIVQGFVFNIVTIIGRKKINKTIIYLNLIVLFLSLNNLQDWLIENGYTANSFLIKKMLLPWYMLIFPMFYMFLINYLKVKVHLKYVLKVSLYVFLFQIILRTSINLYTSFFQPILENILMDRYILVEEIFNAIFGLLIIYQSALLVFKTKKAYLPISEFDDIKWLKIFLILGSIVILFWIFAIVIQNLNGNKLAYYPLRLCTSLLLYWIGYQGLHRYNIVNDRILLRRSMNSELKPALSLSFRELDKELKPFFSEKHKVDFNTINNHIIHHQKFLDPSLNMDSLSKELNMSTSHLSKVINGLSRYNFSDYINSFRVEQAKRLLSNEEFAKYTIVAIGLECGFNSKSTFYSAFKKFTSQTPTAYRGKS